MATLNTDETFWLHLHQMNTNQRKECQIDLIYLAKHEPGKYPLLEELLEQLVLEYVNTFAQSNNSFSSLANKTQHHQIFV
jgi:hypothetical protein